MRRFRDNTTCLACVTDCPWPCRSFNSLLIRQLQPVFKAVAWLDRNT